MKERRNKKELLFRGKIHSQISQFVFSYPISLQSTANDLMENCVAWQKIF